MFWAGSGDAHFTSIEFLNASSRPNDLVQGGEPLTIRLRFDAQQPPNRPYFGIMISTEFGGVIANPNASTPRHDIENLERGADSINLIIDHLPLMPGRCPITLWLNRHSDNSSVDWLEQYVTRAVHTPGHLDAGRILHRRAGAVFFDSHWSPHRS